MGYIYLHPHAAQVIFAFKKATKTHLLPRHFHSEETDYTALQTCIKQRTELSWPYYKTHTTINIYSPPKFKHHLNITGKSFNYCTHNQCLVFAFNVH